MVDVRGPLGAKWLIPRRVTPPTPSIPRKKHNSRTTRGLTRCWSASAAPLSSRRHPAHNRRPLHAKPNAKAKAKPTTRRSATVTVTVAVPTITPASARRIEPAVVSTTPQPHSPAARVKPLKQGSTSTAEWQVTEGVTLSTVPGWSSPVRVAATSGNEALRQFLKRQLGPSAATVAAAAAAAAASAASAERERRQLWQRRDRGEGHSLMLESMRRPHVAAGVAAAHGVSRMGQKVHLVGMALPAAAERSVEQLQEAAAFAADFTIPTAISDEEEEEEEEEDDAGVVEEGQAKPPAHPSPPKHQHLQPQWEPQTEPQRDAPPANPPPQASRKVEPRKQPQQQQQQQRRPRSSSSSHSSSSPHFSSPQFDAATARLQAMHTQPSKQHPLHTPRKRDVMQSAALQRHQASNPPAGVYVPISDAALADAAAALHGGSGAAVVVAAEEAGASTAFQPMWERRTKSHKSHNSQHHHRHHHRARSRSVSGLGSMGLGQQRQLQQQQSQPQQRRRPASARRARKRDGGGGGGGGGARRAAAMGPYATAVPDCESGVYAPFPTRRRGRLRVRASLLAAEEVGCVVYCVV